MRETLLDILAEPGTGSALDLAVGRHAPGAPARGEHGDEILDGTLTSRQTGRTFAITNGIPRFVSADAQGAPSGKQWSRLRDVQLDSVNGTRLSHDRFVAETGWSVDELRDGWVLDLACRAGRFAEIAASGATRFVGLDLSSAVEATRDALRGRFPHAEIVQGDLLNPPFRQGSFDHVYCLGGIEHSPDNAGAIRGVVRLTKKGGRFALSIDGRRPWTKLSTRHVLRPLTKRLPAATLLEGIEKVMPVAFPLTDKLFRLPLFGRVARFAIPIDTPTGIAALERDERLRYELAILDTFDGLSPAHDEPMTVAEVERAIRDVGARALVFRSEHPVIVSGTR